MVDREQTILIQLECELNEIVGLECWSVTAGEGSGSHVSINIGNKIPRIQSLKNPKLSEDARDFTGEFCLFIEEGWWGLCLGSEVLCDAGSDNREFEGMMSGLNQILNEKVDSVSVCREKMDLTIEFRNGVILKLYDADAGYGIDRYSFFTPRGTFIVQNFNNLLFEQ